MAVVLALRGIRFCGLERGAGVADALVIDQRLRDRWRLPVISAVIVASLVAFPTTSSASLQNSGFATNGYHQAAIDGLWIFLLVPEASQGSADLNGDGDFSDEVAHVWNLQTGDIDNLGVATRIDHTDRDIRIHKDVVFEDGVAMFKAWESAQNADLNGDGDMLDSVVHIWEAGSTNLTNSGLAVDETTHLYTAGGAGLILADEADQGVDLDGDGDATGMVAHGWRAGSGLTNLEVEAFDLGFTSEDPHSEGAQIVIAAHEAFARDLNSDGDDADFVTHLWDGATGTLTNLAHPADATAGPHDMSIK
jgi:hypothetical protein